MNTNTPNKIPWVSSKTCQNPTITEWVKASSFFYANYKTLSDHLNTHPDLLTTDPSMKPSVGRCSAKELISLLSLMRQELATLLMDISLPPENTTSTPRINEQLTTHVSRLNRLNQRAQTMIELLNS